MFYCALSKTKHCTQFPVFCLSCHAHLLYVPYLLLFSTLPLLRPLHARLVPCSLLLFLTPTPFSLWQTSSCPFLCLLCLWSLIRKINKKEPIGWKNCGLRSERATRPKQEKPQCNKNIWIGGCSWIETNKYCMYVYRCVSKMEIIMWSIKKKNKKGLPVCGSAYCK